MRTHPEPHGIGEPTRTSDQPTPQRTRFSRTGRAAGWDGRRAARRAGIVLVAALSLAACAGGRRGAPLPAPPREAATLTSQSAVAGTPGPGVPADVPAATLRPATPSGTYLLDVLTAQQFEVVRWSEHLRAPLRVWIADGAGVPGWRPRFPSLVREAFREWCAVGIPVRVAFVPDSMQAEVRVTWVEHFGREVSGRATWRFDHAGVIRAGRVWLSTRRATGVDRPDAQLRAIALHEIGHALGLTHPHRNPTSIMAPRVDVSRLSAADRATARLLYTLPTGRTK